MINKKFALIVACVAFSGCNGGLNLSVPTAVVEQNPIVIDPSLPTPTPDPSASPTPVPTPTATATPIPSPTPGGKNRIFVLNATLKPFNTQSEGFFNYACYREAMRTKIPGRFVALITTHNEVFTQKHHVNGYIYQTLFGTEFQVAENIQNLFAGRNSPINALAIQIPVDASIKRYVWSGQRNFELPASLSENCNDWTGNSGEAIVGLVGASGSDALASQTQSCDTFSHLYCIEINP